MNFLITYKRISFTQLPLWIQFFWYFIVIATLLSFLIFIKKPSSIKSGADFITQYNEINKTKTKGLIARFVSFQFWPIDKKQRQILPHSIANYNNFFFLIDGIFWAESARWKLQKKNFMVSLFFIFRLVNFITILLVFTFFTVWYTSFAKLKAINPILDDMYFHLPAVGFFLIGFFLTFIPRWYMLKFSLKTINQMKINDKDKIYFKKLFTWFWLFPFVFALLEGLQFTLELFAWNTTRLRLNKKKEKRGG